MTSLEELRSELLPAARLVSPGPSAPVSARSPADPSATGEAEARPIAWVRVMKARVPAFDALDPGDLAIVPAPALAVVAQGDEALASLAAAFAAAPLAGVLLVEGEGVVEAAGPDPLDALEAALRDADVPALRLPRADVAALERSVIGFIVARGAELDRQAGLLEAQLQRLAIEGGGTPALIGAVAGFLGRPVALESGRGEILAVHAPPDAREAGSAVARYHARARGGVALRVPLPGGSGRAASAGDGSASPGSPARTGRGASRAERGPGGTTSAGSLALLGDAPASELARVALGRVAGLIALELARDEAVRRAGDRARRADPLPGAGPPWIVLLARQRSAGADDDSSEAGDEREAMRRELRLVAPARRMALRGDADSLEIRAVIALDRPTANGARAPSAAAAGAAIGAPAADAPASDLPLRIAQLLGRTVAVSRPFTSPGERPAAEAEARSTLEAALALAEPPRLARADRLPVYRLLGGLHNLPDGGRLAATLLEPLLTGRADVRRERLATLRALLEHGGVNEAAAALGVHRNTVAYRLRRIEAATGWRLSDPELRLPLSIALRLVHKDQV